MFHNEGYEDEGNSEKIGWVLKPACIDSENRRHYSTMSSVNITSMPVEVGAHLFRGSCGATGKTGTLKEILDSMRKQVENSFYREECLRNVSKRLEKELVSALGRLI